MRLTIKQSVAPKSGHAPHFDFGTNLDPEGTKTATIKELLIELNSERLDDSGGVYDLKSLSTVLRFLSSITGNRYGSIVEKHSLSTIKTIKLLHKKCRHIDAHLIKLIEPPTGDSHGTMDFLTMPSSPEGEDVKRQIRRIVNELNKEIEQGEIDQINAISDPTQFREQYRHDTNEAIDRLLLTHIHIEDELFKEADDHLADWTRQFLTSMSPLEREVRAHVAVSMYLNILEYVHRLHFEISTQHSIPHDHPISNISIDFTKICADVSRVRSREITRDTNFLSLHEAREFCQQHMSGIVEVVSQATKFAYDNRSFKNDIPRALVLMQLYLYSANLPKDQKSKPLGIAHVVSAFASIFHQRIKKANLIKKSVKYSPKIADPQRQLDQFINGKISYIPWTVQFIYAERMKWHLHAILERKDITESHKAFQLVQSELTRDILLSLSPMRILEIFRAYRAYMIRAATDFILAHDRQNVRYEWINNYQPIAS